MSESEGCGPTSRGAGGSLSETRQRVMTAKEDLLGKMPRGCDQTWISHGQATSRERLKGDDDSLPERTSPDRELRQERWPSKEGSRSMIDGRSGGRAGRSTAGLVHMHSTELDQSLTGVQDLVADGMGVGGGWMIK